MKDVYIKDIEDPKKKKDGVGIKQNSGSRWPDGTLYSDTEKADLREIRSKLVDKSDDLHDKMMRVEVLEHYNSAGEIVVYWLCKLTQTDSYDQVKHFLRMKNT